MKKLAVVLVAVFIIALLASSCNEKVCPAYAKAETQQTENNG
jgi:hypothetical protein